MPKTLPAQPHIDWLKKTAKERLQELRASDPSAKLALAQREVANDYGYKSWRALKGHVDTVSLAGKIVAAAATGDADELARLLNGHPRKIDVTGGAWDRPLLHHAAGGGHIACVELLLARGFDVGRRDRFDHATALHWAAGEGHLAVVERLIAAGADIEGEGDDHELGVLGWATCLDRMREDVAEYLLSRGARLGIFPAIALGRADDVRAMVTADPSLLQRRMSRNEQGRLALHHAVQCSQPAIVRLLLELGGDVTAPDRSGAMPLAYARDGGIVQVLLDAGARPDLMSALTLGRYDEAAAMVSVEPDRIGPDGRDTVCLHLTIDRHNRGAMRWLIEHGVDVNAKRLLYDCNQTALHICAERGFVEVANELLAAGARTTILDDKFHADALGWAEYCKQPKVADLIRAHRAEAGADA